MLIGKTEIKTVRGDITKIDYVDAIVNAAIFLMMLFI